MFKIDKEKCIGCEACVNVCPLGAISMKDDKAVIDGSKCVDCGRCSQVCPQEAIYLDSKSQQNISSNQGQTFVGSGFGGGQGGGMGRGMGRGLGRGPRDGRGRGGGGRRR